MRLHYYQFPEETEENVLLENGCGVICKNGETVYVDSIPDDKRELVDHVSRTVMCGYVSTVKNLMKKYGGCGYTEHLERDGGLFEVTDITLKGNNSTFKYNHHL